jgi:hypothetical protein
MGEILIKKMKRSQEERHKLTHKNLIDIHGGLSQSMYVKTL